MSVDDDLADLRQRLARLEERVHLDKAVAGFSSGDHPIRTGDFVRFSDGHVAGVIIGHDGRWTYTDRGGRRIEAFRVPPEDYIDRLYTIQEVEAIVRKAGS